MGERRKKRVWSLGSTQSQNTNTAQRAGGCDFCFLWVLYVLLLCVPKTTKRKNVIFIHESVLKYLYMMYVKFFCIFESMIEIITENYIIHHHTTSLLFYTQNFYILIMYIILNTHLSHLFEADTSTSSQFMLPFAC